MTTEIDQTENTQGNTDDVSTGDQDQKSTLLTSEVEDKKATEGDETKEEVKSEQDKSKEESDETKEEVPEEYEDFTLKEGVSINEETLGKFKGVAKELGLSQDKAQKLIDLAAENNESLQKAQLEAWNKTCEGWVTNLKNNPEHGGDNFKETVTRAQRILRDHDKEGELKTFLNESGFGDNDKFIIFLSKIDKAYGEAKVVDGDRADNEMSAADILYGKK